MNQELKYLYVVLDRPDSPLHSIKNIMFDKKVKGEDGEICFYSPYNELYTAYSKKYPDYKMWGIGFSFKSLKERGIWDGKRQNPQSNAWENGKLLHCNVKANELNFSGLDIKNEVFFIAPNLKTWKNVYFNGLVPGKEKEKWEQWWCKGLRNDHCSNMDDGKIEEYLTGDYHRFFWKNYMEINYNQLFPCTALIPNNYKLLNVNL